MFPSSVHHRIAALLAAAGTKSTLVTARDRLTQRYRAGSGKETQGFICAEEALAYVATRFPATFAAVESVLSHVSLDKVTSVLDLGAGPGTATFAAALRWSQCQHFHLVEGNAFMGNLSRQLLQDIPEVAHQNFSFEIMDLSYFQTTDQYDLVMLSYVLNELSEVEQKDVLSRAWGIAAEGLMIIMPGSPKGYQRLINARDFLIEQGAFIAAPCPTQGICPLQPGDWCHFSVRLPRSAVHRDVKNVSLTYEDEKFSYLFALRTPVSRPVARVIRKPLQRSGHVTLDLCTSQGVKRQTISRRDKNLYKIATKTKWGSEWVY